MRASYRVSTGIMISQQCPFPGVWTFAISLACLDPAKFLAFGLFNRRSHFLVGCLNQVLALCIGLFRSLELILFFGNFKVMFEFFFEIFDWLRIFLDVRIVGLVQICFMHALCESLAALQVGIYLQDWLFRYRESRFFFQIVFARIVGVRVSVSVAWHVV